MTAPSPASTGDLAFRPEPLRAPAHYQFPRSATELLPWSHAEERLTGARNYWLATTRPDGPPHVTPVWGVWLDSSLYFDGLSGTQWTHNLETDARATVHLESAEDVVIVEGVVRDVAADPATAKRVVAAWDAKYGSLTPNPSQGIYQLLPSRARGWSRSSLKDGTRWAVTGTAGG